MIYRPSCSALEMTYHLVLLVGDGQNMDLYCERLRDTERSGLLGDRADRDAGEVSDSDRGQEDALDQMRQK